MQHGVAGRPGGLTVLPCRTTLGQLDLDAFGVVGMQIDVLVPPVTARDALLGDWSHVEGCGGTTHPERLDLLEPLLDIADAPSDVPDPRPVLLEPASVGRVRRWLRDLEERVAQQVCSVLIAPADAGLADLVDHVGLCAECPLHEVDEPGATTDDVVDMVNGLEHRG